MIYVGIDNGKSGGVVGINDKQEIVFKYVMPVVKGKKTDYDITKLAEILNLVKDEVYVVLEKAHVRPISGKTACFMNGYGYGLMQGILASYGIRYVVVRPKDWQQDILKGMNTGDTKKDSIMFCKRMFPRDSWKATERCIKEHDGLTDAACMAVYCYRKFK